MEYMPNIVAANAWHIAKVWRLYSSDQNTTKSPALLTVEAKFVQPNFCKCLCSMSVFCEAAEPKPQIILNFK